MGYLEQDKIYSFLHGKEIEDRIQNYAIFAQFQETLVRYVREQKKDFLKYGHSKISNWHFDIEIGRERITISTKDIHFDGICSHIEYRKFNMEYLSKLSQVNAIYNVLQRKTQVVFQNQLAGLRYTINPSDKIMAGTTFKAFRITVSFLNENYSAPLKW